MRGRIYVALMAIILLFAAKLNWAAENTLRVGAAKVEVTKLSNLPPVTAKYGHEHLFVRAIVIDNGSTRAALISIPGSEFDWPEISTKVSSDLKCPVENILVSATHAHSYRQSKFTGEDPLTTAAVEAVDQAKSRLQTALMGFGTGNAYLNVNRDAFVQETHKWGQYSNLDAPTDRTVAVMKFVTPSDDLIAAFVSYAMHPINAYAVNITTGDFPEAMSQYVEKVFGGNTVVGFFLAAAGDQNPLYLRPSTNAMASRDGNKITGYEMNREFSEGPLRVNDANGKPIVTAPADPAVKDDLLRFIESEGQVLGEEVIRVMTLTKNTTAEARIAGFQTAAKCPGRKRTNGDKMDPKTREGIEGTYVDTPPVDLPMGLLAIGTVALAPVGDEPYALIGLEVKRAAPLVNTVMISLADSKGNTGYIPDDASFGHLTFQALNSTLKQGCAESAIVNTITDLETRYLNGH